MHRNKPSNLIPTDVACPTANMTSTQVTVSTSVNDKGLHATSAVGDKGVQTENNMDEAATMHVDEADVGKKVYRNEDEQIMKEMTHLSKGKDGTAYSMWFRIYANYTKRKSAC